MAAAILTLRIATGTACVSARTWKADLTHWLVYGSLLLVACASSSVGRYDSTDPRPPAGVHVDERVETWRITAGDVSGVRTTLRLGVPRAGGHGYAGQLRWSLHWDYRSTADSSGCKVVEANVLLNTRLKLSACGRAASPALAGGRAFVSYGRSHEH